MPVISNQRQAKTPFDKHQQRIEKESQLSKAEIIHIDGMDLVNGGSKRDQVTLPKSISNIRGSEKPKPLDLNLKSLLGTASS